jgi:hypothetical protein
MKTIKFFSLQFAALFFMSSTLVFANVPDTAPFKNVFIMIFENEEADNVLEQTTFATLAKQGAYLDNFHAITHPSQPNYIALTSGDTQGVKDDKPVNLDSKNIIDLLEAKNISWKVYAEDYPGSCNLVEKHEKYVRKHNPFMSYTNITSNPKRCQYIVNADQLDIDIRSGTLANYSFYIPNLDNDAHDTGIAYADNYLKTAFVPRLKNPAFTKDLLFIITFDEGDTKHPTSQNQIYTLFYGDMVKPQIVDAKYNHYSILSTLENFWQLGSLGLNDATNPPISEIWK